MSLSLPFVYETEDKKNLEIPEADCKSLMPLLQLQIPLEYANYPVLTPPFVQDFNRPDEMTDEEVFAYMEENDGIGPYIGPTFEPAELIGWAETWLALIEEFNKVAPEILQPLSTDFYDWLPTVQEDLTHSIKQAECAQRHGLTMHIELY